MATIEAGVSRSRQSPAFVIGASSLGTIFEWYDFYLYGLLATIISAQFFSGVNETTGFIFALAAFAAGFAVRANRKGRIAWTTQAAPPTIIEKPKRDAVAACSL